MITKPIQSWSFVSWYIIGIIAFLGGGLCGGMLEWASFLVKPTHKLIIPGFVFGDGLVAGLFVPSLFYLIFRFATHKLYHSPNKPS